MGRGCGLADIAPTLLDILQIPKPESMSGISLVNPFEETQSATNRIPQTLGV